MLKQYKEGEILINIEIDEDACPPDDSLVEPTFFRAERGPDLHRELKKEFSNPTNAYNAMASGEIYKTPNGDWFIGFSEYRHGGSAFALCGTQESRSWPDFEWDVIELVGWIKITRQNRIDWGIHGRKGVEDKARLNAHGSLKEWEQYINGEVYGFVVRAYPYDENGDREDPVKEDSCWGFYGMECVESEAKGAAEYMAESLGWTKAE